MPMPLSLKKPQVCWQLAGASRHTFCACVTVLLSWHPFLSTLGLLQAVCTCDGCIFS
jgi:hypothetical protein